MVHHRVDLQDCSIFYQQGGSLEGATPILLLHGWGISTEPYQELLQLLAQQHSVIAPDLPGFARSPYPTVIPSYDAYAQILVAFLDKLNLSQVHLVGHSFGGGIAIALAALAGDRIKSLILLDSTGIPTESIPVLIPRRAIEMTAQLLSPRLHLKLVDIPQVFIHNLVFNPGQVIHALFLSLQGDLSGLFPSVQSPCLLLWSEQDWTIPLSVAQEMSDKISHARLVLVQEGFHEWALWYPEKLVAIVMEFVQQVESRGAIAAHAPD
ncbi:MAG: alpha/beta hydrolase [Oculatellaceae cyanobacterium Prado106]|jgi:pimeloyl-ACP methyl ester carboxylesterase|nr:alpha/beta hydrolase [Oculatellaceae cyanobacterium Prado106]